MSQTPDRSTPTDLLWPGDHLAGDLFTEAALFEAVLRMESLWLSGLHTLGLCPVPVAELGLSFDRQQLRSEITASGNPVAPFVAAVRRSLESEAPEAAPWLHRGLTSQDVLDTVLMLEAKRTVEIVRGRMVDQIQALAGLADRHRGTRQTGRTLTQPAVPITFGLKAAQWLAGVLDAYDDVAALRFPIQLGGAAGTLAAIAELGIPEPLAVASTYADALGLDAALPWHTNRAPVTRIGDALVRCTDAWGRIANDVLTLNRPEIGELEETGGGTSSTMPHKQNPVGAVLVRRAALAAPQLAATLHLAAADTGDERPGGAWHAEWPALRDLGRRTAATAHLAATMIDGLRVDAHRMEDNLLEHEQDLLTEQATMAELAGHAPQAEYLGVADGIVDAVLTRAKRVTA